MALQAVKLLATVVTADEAAKELALTSLNDWCKDGSLASDHVFAVVAAQIYADLGRYKEALQLVVTSKNLEW